MLKSLSTMILTAALIFGPASAAETNTQKITETMDLLQKETACIVVADYSIRHLNIFIHQLEMLKDTNGERKKAADPWLLMVITMRLDAEKLINELVSLGVDRSYIDKKVAEITDSITLRYSYAYIDSTSYSNAASFMQMMMTEQTDCEKWFGSRFGNLPTAPENNGNGGVSG